MAIKSYASVVYMHLLIVDDDTVFCQALEKSLSDLGEVMVVNSYLSASEYFKVHSTDLLIADYFLPDGNGLSLIKEVKAKKIELKTILMSAGATKEIAVASVNMQISALIEKPFLGSEIKTLIHGLIYKNAIVLNERDHQVSIEGHQFSLTPTEFKIFKLLYDFPDKRLNRKMISEKIWGKIEISENAFDTHLGNLKKKMGKYCDLLTNIKGIGYSLLQSK